MSLYDTYMYMCMTISVNRLCQFTHVAYHVCNFKQNCNSTNIDVECIICTCCYNPLYDPPHDEVVTFGISIMQITVMM